MRSIVFLSPIIEKTPQEDKQKQPNTKKKENEKTFSLVAGKDLLKNKKANQPRVTPNFSRGKTMIDS